MWINQKFLILLKMCTIDKFKAHFFWKDGRPKLSNPPFSCTHEELKKCEYLNET